MTSIHTYSLAKKREFPDIDETFSKHHKNVIERQLKRRYEEIEESKGVDDAHKRTKIQNIDILFKYNIPVLESYTTEQLIEAISRVEQAIHKPKTTSIDQTGCPHYIT